MKLGVFINQAFYTDGKKYSTDLAFIRFIESFSLHFEKIFVFAPSLLVSGGNHGFYECSDVISLCALPYYENVNDLAMRLPAILMGSVKNLNTRLRDCQLMWLVGPHPLGLLAYKISKMAGVPVCQHIRGNILNDVAVRYSGRHYLLAKAYANAMHGINSFLSKRVPTMVVGSELYDLYAKKAKALFPISPSLVNKKDIAESRQFLTSSTHALGREVELLFVGRLEPEKGLEYLFRALAILNDRSQRTYRLKLIGSAQRGSHEKEIEIRSKARKSGIEKFLKWADYVPFSDKLLNLYRSADIFVLPSLAEGIPKVLYEAMTAGLPIVATSVGGIPDIIKNEKNGLLVPPGSTDKIVQAVKCLVGDEVLRHSLIDGAFRTVEQHTTENERDHVMKIFTECTTVFS
jgi:glycosyltransferase involved in cell wall biosynthesis